MADETKAALEVEAMVKAEGKAMVDAMEFLLDKLRASRTNSEFFEAMNA